MAVMLAVVILALFGVFGRTIAEAQSSSPQFAIIIEYPERMRYKEVDALRIEITNRSEQVIDTVTVIVSEDYLEGFTDVSFEPSPERISADGYEVELHDMQPGETRIVTSQVRAEEYWTVEGSVTVRGGQGGDMTVPFSTFVFP